MDKAEFDQLIQINSELHDFFQWLIDQNDENREGISRVGATLTKLDHMLNEIEHKRMLETLPDPTSGKFVDEFRAEVIARGFSLPGKLEKVGACHLSWRPPSGAKFDFGHYVSEDPAIVVFGYSRCVAFWRIEGEIRYDAARIVPGAHPWYWSGEDPERVAAVDAESDYHEVGTLNSVEDAVVLTIKYLTGTPLIDISAARTKFK
jgi:hypothetical protein